MQTAAPPPALVRCVTAWNARPAIEHAAYRAGATRSVRIVVTPHKPTDVGGVRSVQGHASVVQLCSITLFRPARRITTVSGVWINGGVRQWKVATGTLTAGSTPVRNARLLPDGRLRL